MSLVEVYVDPAINANTGSGTVGDPYGDLEYAVGQTTYSGLNGYTFFIKAGTAEVLTQPLRTTFVVDNGFSTTSAPTIAGYSSVGGDGGVAEIDCNEFSISSQTTSFCTFTLIQLYIHNCPVDGEDFMYMISGPALFRCKIQGPGVSAQTQYGSNGWLRLGDSVVEESYFYDLPYNFAAGQTINFDGSGTVKNCIFEVGRFDGSQSPIYCSNTFVNNVVYAAGNKTRSTANYLVRAASDPAVIANNIFYNSTTTDTWNGIIMSVGEGHHFLSNNVLVNFAHAGGIGINLDADWRTPRLTNNAFFNCTTNINNSPATAFVENDNETLSEDPVIDAANSNWNLRDIGNLRYGSYVGTLGGGFV